eukprot:5318148-Amphidinium_carterae.1
MDCTDMLRMHTPGDSAATGCSTGLSTARASPFKGGNGGLRIRPTNAAPMQGVALRSDREGRDGVARPKPVDGDWPSWHAGPMM